MTDFPSGYFGCCGRSKARGHADTCYNYEAPEYKPSLYERMARMVRSADDDDTHEPGHPADKD